MASKSQVRPEDEKVRIRLFKDDGKYSQALYVCINGHSWMIPRGRDVEVPKYVAEVIDRSVEEDLKTSEKMNNGYGHKGYN